MQKTQIARKGWRVIYLIGKGRYERYLLHSNSRKILVQEDYATGASTKGVLYAILPLVPLSQVAFAFTISHGVGYLELLILVQGKCESLTTG